MMLDMDEGYLLFQPLFEHYLVSIKSNRRNYSFSAVRSASDYLFRINVIQWVINPIRPEISAG